MSLKLHKADLSPPSRAAMMAIELFGVKAELINVDLMKGEHMTPEYLQKNPVHTVPVLEDGKVVIHDSHAILMYLADVYGKDDTLYPKNPVERAMVNQKLFFESSVLFPRLAAITLPIFFGGAKEFTPKQLSDLDDAYSFLEAFLSKTKYVATDNFTIADVSVAAVISALMQFQPISAAKYPKTVAWFAVISQKPFYKSREQGAVLLGQIVKQIMAS